MNAPVVKKPSKRSDPRNLPECRIAFPFLHEKRTKNAAGQPLKNGPRNDCTLLLPKMGDAATCPNYKMLADMCMEAAGKMWPGVGWPQGGNWPIKDGDIPYVSKPKPGVAPKTPEQIAAANAWRKGHWVIESTNNLETGPRVAVVQNGAVTEIPARVVNGVTLYKSGDYGIPNVSAYAYENDTFGASFSVDGVLFTRAGEAIGSGPKSAAQMFAGVALPAATGPAPAAPMAPAAPAMPMAAPAPTYSPPGAAPMAPVAPTAATATYAPGAAPMAPAAPLPPFPAPR